MVEICRPLLNSVVLTSTKVRPFVKAFVFSTLFLTFLIRQIWIFNPQEFRNVTDCVLYDVSHSNIRSIFRLDKLICTKTKYVIFLLYLLFLWSDVKAMGQQIKMCIFIVTMLDVVLRTIIEHVIHSRLLVYLSLFFSTLS